MPMLESALAYAAKGWAVFPCQPNAKIPRTAHGLKDATTNTKTIESWFAKPGNLGLVTGKQFFVLDVDVKEGRAGDDILHELEQTHSALPPTLEVLTPGHGRHLYFTMPSSGLSNSVDRVGVGLDIRATGGYVLAPPSAINGRAYAREVSCPDEIAEAPGWLLTLARRKTAKKPTADPIPQGTQDDQLHKLACTLTRQGLLPETIRAGLRTALLACPQDATKPFTEKDIDRWIAGASKLIGGTPPDDTPPPWAAYGVARMGKNPVCNASSALALLEHHPDFKDTIWFDTFSHRIMTTWPSRQAPHAWTDDDDAAFLIFLQREMHLHAMNRTAAHDALVVFARRDCRHAVQRWVESLTWDETPRIDQSFTAWFGAPDTPYLHAVSRNFWLSLAARILHPGCQADHMVVLEGPQGVGKTSALRIIGGSWYLACHESVTSKDFFQLLPGHLVVEIAELDAFHRAEVTRIKQVISTTTDTFRASYGRFASNYARQCIFVGTTNEAHYLQDATGGRRFWPVFCQQFDLDALRDNREQCFAEAIARVRRKESWHEMPEITAEEQEARRHIDAWEEPITEALQLTEETTMTSLLLEVLHFSLDRIDRRAELRVARILRHMGWERRVVRREGHVVRRWCPVVSEDAEITV